VVRDKARGEEARLGTEKTSLATVGTIAFRGFCASTVPAWGEYATICKIRSMKGLTVETIAMEGNYIESSENSLHLNENNVRLFINTSPQNADDKKIEFMVVLSK
jgi:hypothetical protein